MSAPWPTPEEVRQHLIRGFEQAQASMPPDGDPHDAIHAAARATSWRLQREAATLGVPYDLEEHAEQIASMADEVLAMTDLRPLRTALVRSSEHPRASRRRHGPYPSFADEDDGPLSEFTSPTAAAKEISRVILEHDGEFRGILLGQARVGASRLQRIREVTCQIVVELLARRFPPTTSFLDAVREVGDAVGAEWVVEPAGRPDGVRTA